MYTETNFPTKKAFKEAVASGEKVRVFQPGGIFPSQKNGSVTIEGPHYPKPHSWYASCKIQDGIVVPGTIR